MKIINVHEAKTHLSRLMEEVVGGETILLGKHGKPMVKLTAYDQSKECRTLGGLEGRIEIAAGFDDEDARILNLFGLEGA